MKKTVLLGLMALLTISFSACTEQERTRTFGGTMEIKLEPGEKLLMATWKESDLFYLTEPMEEGYTPKRKKFRESSSWGAMESTIIFVETAAAR